MKKLFFSICVLSISFLTACNNDPVKEPPSEDSTGRAKQEVPAAAAAELKDHVCSDKCEDGNHFYAHGEIGHICTDECMKENKM